MPPKEMKLGVWAAQAQQYRLGSGRTFPKNRAQGWLFYNFGFQGAAEHIA